MEDLDEAQSHILELGRVTKNALEKVLLLSLGEYLLLASHQLVAAVVLLLASDLLKALLVHPAKEEVLIRVEVGSTHEQMPESLDVLNPDRD